jgi:hypothetical protein
VSQPRLRSLISRWVSNSRWSLRVPASVHSPYSHENMKYSGKATAAPSRALCSIQPSSHGSPRTRQLGKLLLILGVGLLNCAAIVPASDACQSDCGATYFQAGCDAFRHAETVAVDSLARHTGHARQAICQSLEGYVILGRPGVWEASSGHRVSGLAHCDRRILEVSPDTWERTSFVHEIWHAYQDCDPQPGNDCNANQRDFTNGCMHWRWLQTGIQEAEADAWNQL